MSLYFIYLTNKHEKNTQKHHVNARLPNAVNTKYQEHTGNKNIDLNMCTSTVCAIHILLYSVLEIKHRQFLLDPTNMVFH